MHSLSPTWPACVAPSTSVQLPSAKGPAPPAPLLCPSGAGRGTQGRGPPLKGRVSQHTTRTNLHTRARPCAWRRWGRWGASAAHRAGAALPSAHWCRQARALAAFHPKPRPLHGAPRLCHWKSHRDAIFSLPKLSPRRAAPRRRHLCYSQSLSVPKPARFPLRPPPSSRPLPQRSAACAPGRHGLNGSVCMHPIGCHRGLRAHLARAPAV